MITCPICQSIVLNETGEIGLDDNDSQDFYCPVFVDIGPGTRWCHYSRVTSQGCYPEYIAVVPPFRIYWYEVENRIKVEVLGTSNIDWRLGHDIYEAENVDQARMIQLINKFAKLKVFT